MDCQLRVRSAALTWWPFSETGYRGVKTYRTLLVEGGGVGALNRCHLSNWRFTQKRCISWAQKGFFCRPCLCPNATKQSILAKIHFVTRSQNMEGKITTFTVLKWGKGRNHYKTTIWATIIENVVREGRVMSEMPSVLLGIPWPALLLKQKRRPQPYWGGESSGNVLEASNALNYRVWGIPAVLSRGIPGNAPRAFPGSFRNFSGISSRKSQPYWGYGPVWGVKTYRTLEGGGTRPRKLPLEDLDFWPPNWWFSIESL